VPSALRKKAVQLQSRGPGARASRPSFHACRRHGKGSASGPEGVQRDWLGHPGLLSSSAMLPASRRCTRATQTFRPKNHFGRRYLSHTEFLDCASYLDLFVDHPSQDILEFAEKHGCPRGEGGRARRPSVLSAVSATYTLIIVKIRWPSCWASRRASDLKIDSTRRTQLAIREDALLQQTSVCARDGPSNKLCQGETVLHLFAVLS
jgi:hypothetical protein